MSRAIAVAAFLAVIPLPGLGSAVRAQTAVGEADRAARPRSDALITDYAGATITRPPDSLELDTTFYAKYTSALGIPVVSSAEVPDEALLVARDIVIHMTSARPDVRAAMVSGGYRVGVMAVDEYTTDLPEQRDWKKPAIDDPRLTPGERARYNEPGGIGSMTDREYWNRRARGMGGRYTTCAEENVLGYPDTRYYGENILVHEFSHGIMSVLRRIDENLYADLRQAYESAMEKGLYRGHYASNTIAEYWAEGTQWWFWSNYEWRDGERTLWSPDDLEEYDPALFEILSRVYPDHHIPMDVYHGKRLRPNR